MRTEANRRHHVTPLLLHLRNRHFLLIDLIMLIVLPAFALALRTDALDIDRFGPALFGYIVVSLLIRVPIFHAFGLYQRYWRYASIDELLQIAAAVTISSSILVVVFWLVRAWQPAIVDLPRSLPLIDSLLILAAVGASRFSVRLAERRQHRKPQGARRVGIMGAGDAGIMILKEIQRNPELGLQVAGFWDDDPAKHGIRLHGVPVWGGRREIPGDADRFSLDQVIIAMPTAPGKAIREIVHICEDARVRTKTIPGMYEVLDGTVSVNQLRNVEIEDLLRREPVQTDIAAVRELLEGRRVLITGGGGSIGSELCRQVLRCNPAELVLVGHGENSIFEIYHELLPAAGPDTNVQAAIADVRFPERINGLFRRFRPDVVFHTAAHKHVPLMEANPAEAITNNVLGTRNLVEAALTHGVGHFVMISTDKAVNPTSIMGASKRAAELLVYEAALRSGRPYATVRFGNVLGSRGSVVLTFKRQIAAGGPVTVTDPEMRRFFMTIPEAVQLVLQAAVLGRGGEVFVLDMGEPVKIVDLARDLIELSGLEVGSDVDIVYSGIRPGEKLFEELFVEGEEYERTRHDKIFIARNASGPGADGLGEAIYALDRAAAINDGEAIRRLLGRLIPEYRPMVQAPSDPGPVVAEEEAASQDLEYQVSGGGAPLVQPR